MSTVILPPPLPPQQQQAPEMTHPGRRSPTSVGGSACHRGLAHSRSIPKIHHHQYHSPPAAEAAADFHHHQFALDFTKWKKALLLLITTTTAQDNNINVPLQPKKEDATGNEEEDSGDQEAEDQCSAVHPLGLDVLNSIIDSLSVDSLRDRLKALVVPAQKLMDGLQSTRTERSEQQQQQQSASPSPPAPRQFYSRVHPPSVVPTHISNNNNNISSGGNGSRLLQSTIGAQRLTTNDSSSLLNYGVVEVKPMFAILDNNSPVITKPLLVTTGGGGDSANSSTTTGGRIEPYGAFLNTLTATVGDRQGGDDESWELNQYLMLELLGQGSQGCVYLGYDNVGNEFRAIKEIKRPLAVSAAMTQIKSEVDIMKRLRHRNLISLYELIDDPKAQYMYLVMRYAEKGILVKYTNAEQTECETVELSKVQYYAKQLLSALAYLHNHDIYHRDIKPENVLCGRDDEVYLADFGVAQMLGAAGIENDSVSGCSRIGSQSDVVSIRSTGGSTMTSLRGGCEQPPRRVDSKYTSSNSHSTNSISESEQQKSTKPTAIRLNSLSRSNATSSSGSSGNTLRLHCCSHQQHANSNAGTTAAWPSKSLKSSDNNSSDSNTSTSANTSSRQRSPPPPPMARCGSSSTRVLGNGRSITLDFTSLGTAEPDAASAAKSQSSSSNQNSGGGGGGSSCLLPTVWANSDTVSEGGGDESGAATTAAAPQYKSQNSLYDMGLLLSSSGIFVPPLTTTAPPPPSTGVGEDNSSSRVVGGSSSGILRRSPGIISTGAGDVNLAERNEVAPPGLGGLGGLGTQRPPQIETSGLESSSKENGTSYFASTRGTPAYFSPELAAGIIPECDLDLAAVDVWALGVTLYQLLCGKLPFSTAEKTNHAQTPGRAQQISGSAPSFGSVRTSTSDLGREEEEDMVHKKHQFPRVVGEPLESSPVIGGGDREFHVSSSINRSNCFEHSGDYLDNVLHDDLCPIDTAKVPKEWEKILRGMLHKDPDRRMTVQELRARLKAMDHTSSIAKKKTASTKSLKTFSSTQNYSSTSKVQGGKNIGVVTVPSWKTVKESQESVEGVVGHINDDDDEDEEANDGEEERSRPTSPIVNTIPGNWNNIGGRRRQLFTNTTTTCGGEGGGGGANITEEDENNNNTTFWGDCSTADSSVVSASPLNFSVLSAGSECCDTIVAPSKDSSLWSNHGGMKTPVFGCTTQTFNCSNNNMMMVGPTLLPLPSTAVTGEQQQQQQSPAKLRAAIAKNRGD